MIAREDENNVSCESRGKKGPHPVDIHVGKVIRMRRTIRGMSQEELGYSVGITFQQIQKYERGINRVGSSRLYELSRILGIDVSQFFQGLSPDKDCTKDESDDNSLQDRGRKFIGADNREDDEFLSVSGHNNVGVDLDGDYETSMSDLDLDSKEVITLVRSYNSIKNAGLRRKILSLVRTISSSDNSSVKGDDVEN